MSTSQPQLPRDIEGITRVSQIITLALMSGVVLFSGIALVIAQGNAPPANAPAPQPGNTPVLTYMALGMLAFSVPLSFVVPRLMSAGQLKQIRQAVPDDQMPLLLMLFQTRLIVGLALLEGAAFFVIVAYITEGVWWSMLLVAGLLVLMAGRFPTRYGIEAWVEDQKRSIDLES